MVPGQFFSQPVHALVVLHTGNEGTNAVEHGHGVRSSQSRDLQVPGLAVHVLEVLIPGIRMYFEQAARAHGEKSKGWSPSD